MAAEGEGSPGACGARAKGWQLRGAHASHMLEGGRHVNHHEWRVGAREDHA